MGLGFYFINLLLVLSKQTLYPKVHVLVEATPLFHWCWFYYKHFGNTNKFEQYNFEFVFACNEALLKCKNWRKYLWMIL